MGNKKIGPIHKAWYVVKYKFHAWLEWQDAKDWAREYHPAWVELARKARHEETRKAYKQKILLAYKGYEEAFMEVRAEDGK